MDVVVCVVVPFGDEILVLVLRLELELGSRFVEEGIGICVCVFVCVFIVLDGEDVGRDESMEWLCGCGCVYGSTGFTSSKVDVSVSFDGIVVVLEGQDSDSEVALDSTRRAGFGNVL